MHQKKNVSASIVASVLAFVPLSAARAADPPAAAVAHAPERAPKALDLRAPDIHDLYTAQEIDNLLAPARRGSDENIEEVEVEGERGTTPYFTPAVWGGIAAPIWAILHPTQAWRIIAPLPPDRAGARQVPRVSVLDAYQLEPAAQTGR